MTSNNSNSASDQDAPTGACSYRLGAGVATSDGAKPKRRNRRLRLHLRLHKKKSNSGAKTDAAMPIQQQGQHRPAPLQSCITKRIRSKVDNLPSEKKHKIEATSHQRNGPRCLFCNAITQEQARKLDVLRAKEKGKKSKKTHKTRGPPKNRPQRLLKCHKCQASVHECCAKKFLLRMEEVGLQDFNYANALRDFLQSQEPVFFLASDQSHCCMHNEFLKRAGLHFSKVEESPVTSTTSVAAKYSSATTPASMPPWTWMLLDGMLCFPTSHCMVAPSITYPEVSSVAPSSTHPNSGLPHFVISADKAMALEKRRVAPQTNNSIVLADFRLEETIIHPISRDALQITARVQVRVHRRSSIQSV